MNISDDKKVDVLTNVLNENRRQAIWVKNLDFKIIYYTLLLFLALVAWVSSEGLKHALYYLMSRLVFTLFIIDALFLTRNHLSHYYLNKEYFRIIEVLKLSNAHEYDTKAVIKKSKFHNYTFHGGRILYIAFFYLALLLLVGYWTIS